MKVIVFNNNSMETNCYVLESENEAIVIDPCYRYDLLSNNIRRKLKAVFVTHGHFDHFLELASYKNHNLNFYMHNNCLKKISDKYRNCSAFCGVAIELNLNDEVVNLVKENDEINLNDFKIKVIELFGHTDCSIGYIAGDKIFLGDCVFKGSIGRCDLPTGSNTVMNETVARLKQIKDDYVLYPGHGEVTTLYDEIKNNKYFNGVNNV